MKSLLLLITTILGTTIAQRLPIVPLVGTGGAFVASLGGVPVGGIRRSQDFFGGTETRAASIAGAKVGISGRDNLAASKVLPYPVIKPVVPLPRTILDPYQPYFPYGPYLPYRPIFQPPFIPYPQPPIVPAYPRPPVILPGPPRPTRRPYPPYPGYPRPGYPRPGYPRYPPYPGYPRYG